MCEKSRQEMIETQLIPRGIHDQRVLKAMLGIPREKFIPPDLQKHAYADWALPIGQEQTISQPYIVAVMTELLELKGDEKVLEIGTGSGYQAAILCELARQVYSIDRIKFLTQNAQKLLAELGYRNIKFITQDGTLGYEKEAPFDSILVTAAAPAVPPTLINQLNEGGKLVIPLGNRWSQILTRLTKKGKEIQTTESIPCVFVPLVGKYGW